MVVRPGFEPTMSMRESINAESANESSSAFEQDSFVLETKISRLEQEVTKCKSPNYFKMDFLNF